MPLILTCPLLVTRSLALMPVSAANASAAPVGAVLSMLARNTPLPPAAVLEFVALPAVSVNTNDISAPALFKLGIAKPLRFQYHPSFVLTSLAPLTNLLYEVPSTKTSIEAVSCVVTNWKLYS